MRKFFWYTGLLVITIGLWQVASMFIDELFVPPPMTTLQAFLSLLKSGQLVTGLGYSMRRITIASGISMGLSILIAFLVYYSQLARDTIIPITNAIRYVPVTAFSPILMMCFGATEIQKVSFLFIAIFLPVLPSVVMCLEEVPEELIDSSLTLQMSKLKAMRFVVSLYTLPTILKTFVSSYSIGWTYIALVEMSNAKFGLGYIMYTSMNRYNMANIYAAVITIIIFGKVFDMLGDKIITAMFPWRA